MPFFFLLLRQKANKSNANAYRTKKTRPRRGEAGPSDAKHRHVKSNNHRTPPAKDNPHATKNHHKTEIPTYVVASNSTQYVIFSSIEDIPCASCLVKTLEHGHNIVVVNIDMLDHSFPCRLGVDDEFIPNTMFDLRFTSLFKVKHFVIVFNPK